MRKITIKQMRNKHVVSNRLSYPEVINEREMNAITKELIVGLVPLVMEKSRKDIVVKATFNEMINLNTYFSGIVSKVMFLNIIHQMISLIKECEKNHMNVSNLLLDINYIFIDQITKKVKFIFWPIVNNQNTYSVRDFFYEIPFQVVFNNHEDSQYISEYQRYFEVANPFSINAFEKIIQELMGKSTSNSFQPSGYIKKEDNIRSTDSGSTNLRGGTGSVEYNPISSKVIESSQEFNSKKCSTCGFLNVEVSKFCSSCGEKIIINKINIPSSVGGTTVLGQEDENQTTILGYENLNKINFPYLIREKVQEKIDVNKPSFRIGKEKSYSDYFVSDNNAISRSHADIISKENRYFILDNNSTNKTYIENRAIPVKVEVEIFSGTKLRLADEEFTFYI